MTWSPSGAVVFEQTAAWWRALAWPGLTHEVVTPWQLGQLMDLDPSAFIPRPGLQLMVTAGALTPALADETVRRLTPNILIDVASTETSIWAAALARSPDDLRWQAPFDDRPVEVVDEAGEPVPVGRYGIVRMRTKDIDPLAYLGDPAATAAAFKDGWFYPGDLGILRADGRLSLQGRNADVIVAAGEKRPAAIWEQALQERLACEAVCLVSGAFASGVEELHVFVETRRPIPSAELAAAVRETLVGFAEYRVHPVASLPRTPTGKVRRLALTQMLIEGAFAVDGTRRY
jgi:acyl-coenzyme A synthetase/AMP-(fatty) acid ligase